ALPHRCEKQACPAVVVLASALTARIRPLRRRTPARAGRVVWIFGIGSRPGGSTCELPANTAEIMTRQTGPDDVHGSAADMIADAAPAAPRRDPAGGEAPAPARGAEAVAPSPPADYAAIRSIMAGIMVAMFISALEQTIVAPALPAI